MRVNSFQLIKLCCTRTDPAAKTKSIGLQADARVVMVFASPSGQIYYNMTNPADLSGPCHLDSFIVTSNFRPCIRTLQKLMPTLTPFATTQGRLTATHYYSAALTIRRAVSCKAEYSNIMTANAQARVLQPVPATIPSLQNTCFFARTYLFFLLPI